MHGESLQCPSFSLEGPTASLQVEKIWDIYEGRQLFRGIDPEHHAYRRRAHLAEIIALLGPPPTDLLARGNLTSKFFSQEGGLSQLLISDTQMACVSANT